MGDLPRKFRVWDGEEMYVVCENSMLELVFSPRSLHFEESYGWELRVKDPHDGKWSVVAHSDDGELMQATGLTDAEGLDIYEGDLISAKLPIFFGQTRIGMWRVEYDAARASFQMWHGRMQQPLPRAQGVEICGNRYENPEAA